MILSKIDEYWHLLEAVREGKTLQRLIMGEWADITGSTGFVYSASNYRVKPEIAVRWVAQFNDGFIASSLCFESKSGCEYYYTDNPHFKRAVKLVQEIDECQ